MTDYPQGPQNAEVPLAEVIAALRDDQYTPCAVDPLVTYEFPDGGDEYVIPLADGRYATVIVGPRGPAWRAARQAPPDW